MAEPIVHLLVDRDGVLNQEADEGWVTHRDRWVWIPGSLEALVTCHRVGIAVSVVTNQSAIGRGITTAADVDRLHGAVAEQVERAGGRIDRFLVCPHAPEAGCACRKPAPGLLLEAMEGSGTPTDRCLLVGDDLRDLDAAAAAGIGAVLVRTGKGTDSERHRPEVPAFDDLASVVASLVAGNA